MIEFDDTVTRLKQVLAQKTQRERILDKEVAASLQLSPQYFAVIKRRKKIPYEALAHFSKQHHVNLNWLLLAQDPPYLT